MVRTWSLKMLHVCNWQERREWGTDIYNTNWFHLFYFPCGCLIVILAIILMLLFPITLRKVILKAGDLEHRCVRCKGSQPQRHSNWLKETPPNGAAKDPVFVHLFVSRLSCDSLFNFWSLECLFQQYFNVLLLLELRKGKIGNPWNQGEL